jgi:hypothetical protein
MFGEIHTIQLEKGKNHLIHSRQQFAVIGQTLEHSSPAGTDGVYAGADQPDGLNNQAG